ncbi:MAG: hypothetical protein RLZZ303_530 [Candidatus Hydrogenedentota bacterium]
MQDSEEHFARKLAHETDSWDLHEALNRGDAVTVVDARSPEAYALEHLPGAINLPHRQMDPSTTATFDATRLYVVYCDGIGCNASTKGALQLARLGFHVKELMGGLDWWKRDGYATDGDEGRDGRRARCGC